MTFGRGAVLCWQLVQMVALIAYCGCGMLRGQPGRPVDLVMGNFGAVGVDLFPGDQGGWSLWLLGCMGFCQADRGGQSTWFMRGNFETFKL